MKFHNDIFDRISIEKKERILNVATEEFAKYGYSGTNVNVIADKLQLSVGSLYKYFDTKENFFSYSNQYLCNSSGKCIR